MSLKEQYWKYSLIVLILGLGVIIFMELTPFLSGLLGASTLYILVRGQMRHLTRRKKMQRGMAAFLLLGETVLLFLIPLGIFVWLVVDGLQHVNFDPQTFLAPVERVVANVRERTGYDLFETENLKSIVALVPRISQFVAGWAGGLGVNIFVMLFVLYFMLVGGDRMEAYVSELLPFNRTDKRSVLNEVNRIVKSNAIGIPLLALIQGAVALAGYYFFQVPSPLLFGVLTCFATIIPLVGTALIWFPLVVYLMLASEWWQALGLLTYAMLVITQVDNLVRFLLQKKLADTHPLITIFGVVIGLSLFGFMGIIFGPLLISIFVLCVNIFKGEYLEGEALPGPDAPQPHETE